MNPVRLQSYLMFHLFYVMFRVWLGSELMAIAAEVQSFWARRSEPVNVQGGNPAGQGVNDQGQGGKEAESDDASISSGTSGRPEVFYSKRERQMLDTFFSECFGGVTRQNASDCGQLPRRSEQLPR